MTIRANFHVLFLCFKNKDIKKKRYNPDPIEIRISSKINNEIQ